MQDVYIFIDSSSHPQTKVGFGAFLIINTLNFSNELSKEIKCVNFSDTSSTKLELQTLLYVLNSFDLKNKMLHIFTDSQNIISLLKRQDKLEGDSFYTSSGKKLNNCCCIKSFMLF